MLHFELPDMTCGHCVKAVTAAIQGVDPTAQVQADVARHQVHVVSTAAVERLAAALTDAGYTPAPAAA
jgi:copper chaperone